VTSALGRHVASGFSTSIPAPLAHWTRGCGLGPQIPRQTCLRPPFSAIQYIFSAIQYIHFGGVTPSGECTAFTCNNLPSRVLPRQTNKPLTTFQRIHTDVAATAPLGGQLCLRRCCCLHMQCNADTRARSPPPPCNASRGRRIASTADGSR
jgi:hypothetical protein